MKNQLKLLQLRNRDRFFFSLTKPGMQQNECFRICLNSPRITVNQSVCVCDSAKERVRKMLNMITQKHQRKKRKECEKERERERKKDECV